MATLIAAGCTAATAGAAVGNGSSDGSPKAGVGFSDGISSEAGGSGFTFGRGFRPAKPERDTPSTAGLADAIDSSSTSESASKVGTTEPVAPSAAAAPTGASFSGNAAPGAVGASTLVLYDTTGPYGWLGELYGMYAGNLASHFGSWKAQPVASYQAGQIAQYTATIYIGSTYDEPLPTAFLDDVYNATKPVIWIYDNIWALTNRFASFQTKYGWNWWQFDTSAISRVNYKGVALSRDSVNNGAGIMEYSAVDTTRAKVLATAVRDSDGSEFPWALRSGTLTYVGENPFVYTSETDRVLAFDDLLFDALNPTVKTRHRALFRIEDINPTTDAKALKAIADYLYQQKIPYGFGVSPVYVDPLGRDDKGTGRPRTVKLSDRGNAVAPIIKYMQQRGGTLIMHGYTHQYSNVPNPYNGVTGDDFEFFRVTENADHTLNFQGPVPEDSRNWALTRLYASFYEFQRAGISYPSIFEFPHYTGSTVDYQAVGEMFQTRWERSLYFGNYLSGGTVDYTHMIGQFLPYVVRDVYGTTVLPENAGDYEPEPFFQFPIHTVADVLAAAKAESVVRDGIVGFYFHTYWGIDPLTQMVDGLRAQGWTFASPTQVAAQG